MSQVFLAIHKAYTTENNEYITIKNRIINVIKIYDSIIFYLYAEIILSPMKVFFLSLYDWN